MTVLYFYTYTRKYFADEGSHTYTWVAELSDYVTVSDLTSDFAQFTCQFIKTLLFYHISHLLT